jgi:hypothetical protein
MVSPTAGRLNEAGMSYVELTHDMATLLVALRSWPHVDLEALRAMPEWKLAQSWGWIEESGELTVTGARHAGIEIRPAISE